MYLLFSSANKERPALPDGSRLSLTECKNGWFCEARFKDVVDELGWDYTEVDSITPAMYPI
jgi:hypothetical protein